MSNYQQNYNQAQQNGIQPRKPKFSAMIQTPSYQKSLQKLPRQSERDSEVYSSDHLGSFNQSRYRGV